jgi:hypothetical protein
MGIILAAFFFGLITFGFTLLTVLPLFLLWLMVGVYLEPSSGPAPSADAIPIPAPAPAPVPASTNVDGLGLEALTPGHHLVPSGRRLAGGLR